MPSRTWEHGNACTLVDTADPVICLEPDHFDIYDDESLQQKLTALRCVRDKVDTCDAAPVGEVAPLLPGRGKTGR